jgi:Polyketide cyclase / dehydrase and lipid transport
MLLPQAVRHARFALAALLALSASAGGGFAQGAAQAAVPRNRPESAQALLDAQPEDVVEELMDERLVLMSTSSSDSGLVEALVLFSQPVETVWALLIQRERQNEYRPELTEIEVVERAPNALLEEQHLKIAFLSVSYRLRNRFDEPTRTITFEIDPSYESTIQHVSGYWELHALDGGRTLARFGTRVNVSSAVPGFLQNGITRKNVPESLENTRQWVDSGGRWRP